MNIYPSSFWSDDPYVHSHIYNFRSEVNIQTNKDWWQFEISQASTRLEEMENALMTKANSFLQPWGGDYKKASLDLFGGTTNEGDTSKRYAAILNEILNSRKFLEYLQKTSQKTDKKAKEELEKILESFEVEKTLRDKILADPNFLEEAEKKFIEIIKKQNSASKKRIDLTNLDTKKYVEIILGNVTQKYLQNMDSLKKEIEKKLSKLGQNIDWNKAFVWVKDNFLKRCQQERLDLNSAENFIEDFREIFIRYGKNFVGVDYSNLTGDIGEWFGAAIINKTSLEVSAYVVGSKDEPEVVDFANRITNEINAKRKNSSKVSSKSVEKDQIKPMGSKGAKGKKSGTDWILVNQNGEMVRAQVKNSIDIIEELRARGRTGKPQTMKVQDTINYETFKQNVQNFSKGKGGLSSEDWLFLDYLITNIIWFRSVKEVKMNKKKNGNKPKYRTDISGVQEVVNRLLSKEMGYFLGITTLDPIGKENAVRVEIGASNIFFVMDNKVLYPTYLIVRAIRKQLEGVAKSIATLYVSFETVKTGSSESFYKKKKDAMEKDGPRDPWGPYGAYVLSVGKEKGVDILKQIKIRRGNLYVNIDEIMSDFFGNALKYTQ